MAKVLIQGRRLVFIPQDSQDQVDAEACGGTYRRETKCFSFPLEPTLIYRWRKQLKELHEAPSVTHWLEQDEAETREAAGLREALEAPGNPLLTPIQRADVVFMKKYKKVLDLNPTGTGKTVESMTAIDETNSYPCLIVCKTSKMAEMAAEANLWLPFHSITIVYGTPGKRHAALSQMADIVIVNHDMLRTKGGYFKTLAARKWKSLIIDEAHHFSGRKASRTKGMMTLAKVIPLVLLLTASPVRNRPGDLWTLLHTIAPERFSSYWQFVNRFTEFDNSPFPKPIGVKNVDVLRYILVRYTIARDKDLMLPQLPPLTKRIIQAELPKEQRALYHSMLHDLHVVLKGVTSLDDLADPASHYATSVGSKITKLRQIVADPKILGLDAPSAKTLAITEFMEDHPDEKVVVFCWYRDHAELLVKELTVANNTRGQVYHGGMSWDERESSISKWREDPKCRILVGTIKSMGESLNFQKDAHIVILADRSFVPDDNEQARDRLYRMGQEYSVLVIEVISPDTLDDHLTEILNTKTHIKSEVTAIQEMARMLLESSK